MRMIAVINQKGGVGKTTTTMNLAHALARGGKRILVLDLDPQANLTLALGKTDHPAGIGDVFMDGGDVREVILNARENLDLIPAGDRLAEFEYHAGGAERGFKLHKVLDGKVDAYDFVMVDCPPSSGILGMNALLATKEVLIPVSGDFFALQGLSRMMNIFEYIEGTLKRETRKWVVLTRFQERRRLARDVKEKLVNYFPKQVLFTPIRENVALTESPGFGQTIFDYRERSAGAKDYLELATDLLEQRVHH